MSSRLSMVIGIATSGRRELVSAVISEISRQIRLPDLLLVCPASADDFDTGICAGLPFKAQTVQSAKGLTTQRNAILDVARAYDIVVFFDDDFVPAPTYLDRVEHCFLENPDVVAASGDVLADGIGGPGIPLPTAQAILAQLTAEPKRETLLRDQYNAYGCNMVLRLSTVYESGLRFDENLPLYGWLEDVDFCRRLARHGRVVKDHNLYGVHLGTKGGRTSGLRFGYSQIANPIYLWRKGTLRGDKAIVQMTKNVASNIRKFFNPEPWADRQGRFRGNMQAFRDLARGCINPRKVLELGQ